MKLRMARKFFGFTLIELMIVVVVIGVLAAIAYPSYRQSVYKSRRSDARSAVLQVQLAEEKWRANHTTYTGTLSDLGFIAVSGVYYSADNYYTLTVSNATGTTYTITATYTGVQTGDTSCKTFSMNQDSSKTSTNSADATVTNCW